MIKGSQDRDALSVLKSAEKKVAKIRNDVESAVKQTEEIRLKELIDLQDATGTLAEIIDQSVNNLRKCFLNSKSDESRPNVDSQR